MPIAGQELQVIIKGINESGNSGLTSNIIFFCRGQIGRGGPNQKAY
jgi:hypothetical protein